MTTRMLGIFLASTLALGCGSSTGPTGTITGKVTVGGVPLKGGTICFLPASPDATVMPFEIKDDGTYTATGLPQGDLLIAVIPPIIPAAAAFGGDSVKEQVGRNMRSGQAVSNDDIASAAAALPPQASARDVPPVIDQKYLTPHTSGLTVKLDSDQLEFNVIVP